MPALGARPIDETQIGFPLRRADALKSAPSQPPSIRPTMLAHHLDQPSLEDLCLRPCGAEAISPRHPPRRDFRAAWPEWRRQDDADQHHLRHRHGERRHVTADGHDIIRDYRAARSLIGLVPQELTIDFFETVWATVKLQPRPLRQGAGPRLYREGAARPFAVGPQGQPDQDAFGRHEAPAR